MTSLLPPAPSRKQFRLSRNKSKTDIVKASRRPIVKPSAPIVRPSGGSREKRPFDPSELSRRLELYQHDQELAQERRKTSGKTVDDSSSQDRTDSAHDEDSKSDSASSNANSEEEGALEQETKQCLVLAPARASIPVRKPEIARQPSRPRMDRRVSSSRGRRTAPGTYFPKYAAKQFSATTYSATGKQPRKDEASRKTDSKNTVKLPKPKHTFEEFDFPKAIDREVASDADIAAFKERRGGLLLPATNVSSTNNPRAMRPRPLSVALDELNLEDEQGNNPYMLNSTKHGQGQLNEYSGATQHAGKDVRPSMLYNDHRHDWSQASQCGDDARQSLHLHSLWKNDSPGSDAKTRTKRQQSLPEGQTLISDAVKLVKEERRKSSLLGFLKRHH